jgi:hypothetical protein
VHDVSRGRDRLRCKLTLTFHHRREPSEERAPNLDVAEQLVALPQSAVARRADAPDVSAVGAAEQDEVLLVAVVIDDVCVPAPVHGVVRALEEPAALPGRQLERPRGVGVVEVGHAGIEQEPRASNPGDRARPRVAGTEDAVGRVRAFSPTREIDAVAATAPIRDVARRRVRIGAAAGADVVNL